MNIKNYDLVIFDCDGTLVDSEYLNNKVSADVLNDFGLLEYTPEKCLENFAGRSWTEIKKILDKRHNIDIPQSLIDDYVQRLAVEIEVADISIAGAKDFVHYCNSYCKIAVGSNGERSNVFNALRLQNFRKYFAEEQIFTKAQVKNAKPAPDLFLYAAEKMGIEPSRCLVIEDSVSGAQAGLNAGMDVFGFTGVAHDRGQAESKLNDIGITHIFDSFIHMQEHLKA